MRTGGVKGDRGQKGGRGVEDKVMEGRVVTAIMALLLCLLLG